MLLDSLVVVNGCSRLGCWNVSDRCLLYVLICICVFGKVLFIVLVSLVILLIFMMVC